MRKEHYRMNEEDPRLTAYVLGETDPEDSRLVEECLSGDPVLKDEERELRETVLQLREGRPEPQLMLDPLRRAELYSRLGAGGGEVRWWRRAAVLSGMAACICGGLSVGLLLPSLGRWSGVPAVGRVADSDSRDTGGVLSFGFRLESDKSDVGGAMEGFGAESSGGGVQQPDLRRSAGMPAVAGAAHRVVPGLPEPPRTSGRVPQALVVERPMAAMGKADLEKGAVQGGENLRRSGVGGKRALTLAELSPGVSRVAAAPAVKGNSSVWGGQDLASRNRAAQSLESVAEALKEGRWPEPGSFTAADLVSAYADLTVAVGGSDRMDFRFAAAVASFGTLLEKPEGADSLRWEEVLEMAAGSAGGSGELRKGFLGLVESARKLARKGGEKR